MVLEDLAFCQQNGMRANLFKFAAYWAFARTLNHFVKSQLKKSTVVNLTMLANLIAKTASGQYLSIRWSSLVQNSMPKYSQKPKEASDLLL